MESWVIPPMADAEFVASMESVLDTYAMPYDPRFPVVGMDEQPVQLLKETRVPIPAAKGGGQPVSVLRAAGRVATGDGPRAADEGGCGLNVAEYELSVMTRQCVHGRRFGPLAELRAETTAWQVHTNDRQRGVEWQFQIDDARVKLKSLDPKMLP